MALAGRSIMFLSEWPQLLYYGAAPVQQSPNYHTRHWANVIAAPGAPVQQSPNYHVRHWPNVIAAPGHPPW